MSECEPLQFVNENITNYVANELGSRCNSPAIVIPTIIIYSAIFVLGVVGNVCTCIVIVANRSMHNPTNFYLFSLAISDIVVLLLGLPMELYGALDYTYPYVFGDVVCKARAFLIEFTSYASVLIICSFSVERWMAICYPLRIKIFSTLSRAYVLILAAWTISFFAALPMAFIVKINRLPLPHFAKRQPWTYQVSRDGLTVDRTDFCAMDVLQIDKQRNLIYFAFFAFFMAPACIITIMYGQIALKLRNADSYLVKGRNSSTKRSKSTKNVMKMLVSVVVTFFICWLPFHIQRLLSVFMNSRPGEISPAIQFVFTLVFYISGYCYYSNSACNPILYNILSQKYRRSFCRTILGENMSKRIFPKWYEKHKVKFRRSNVDVSSHTHKGSVSAAHRPLLPEVAASPKTEKTDIGLTVTPIQI